MISFILLEHFQPELSQPSKEALLVYQDDSSDELNDKLDEMLLPASDTDNDDWDTTEVPEAESSGDEGAEDVVGNLPSRFARLGEVIQLPVQHPFELRK